MSNILNMRHLFENGRAPSGLSGAIFYFDKNTKEKKEIIRMETVLNGKIMKLEILYKGYTDAFFFILLTGMLIPEFSEIQNPDLKNKYLENVIKQGIGFPQFILFVTEQLEEDGLKICI
jgi:hypothetical protein